MSYMIPLPGPDARRVDIIDGMSTAVQRALRRDGLSAYEPTTAATLLALFDCSEPRLVFYDVGANMGLYSLLCAGLFCDATVVAFEPTPSTAEVARCIVKANRFGIEVVEAAVGDANGDQMLHLSAKSDSSNSLVSGFKHSVKAVRVPVVTIDSFVASGAAPPTVMKIDVETHEPAALRGAQRTIEIHRPAIVVEVLNRQGTNHGPSIEATVDSLGYRYFHLGPTPEWEPRRHISGVTKPKYNDWLLVPEELTSEFEERFATWAERLSACGPEHNGRLPVMASARATFRVFGWKEALPLIGSGAVRNIRRRYGRSPG